MDIESVFPNGLSLEEAVDLLWPVTIYVAGMAAYAVFIFRFYRFVAARDMFALDLSRFEEARLAWLRRVLHVVMYALKYLVAFPAFAFVWFAVLTSLLAILSKDQAFSEILLVALATVSAIRVTAYYSEDLSQDVAKILPFTVLAVFLIDASFFELEGSLEVLKDADAHREQILYYLLYLVAVEFALRLLLGAVHLVRGERPPDTAPEPEPAAGEGSADPAA